MRRILIEMVIFLCIVFPVFTDTSPFSDGSIEVRPVFGAGTEKNKILFISHYVHKAMSFSELDRYLGQTKYYNAPYPLYFKFYDYNYVVDVTPPWLSSIKGITFLDCTIELNGVVFPNVTSLSYYPKNYTPEFYKSFPNIEKIVMVGPIVDLSFLWKLPNLKEFQMETSETDKTILSKMFRQYFEYITQTKTNMEGYVSLANVYNYPHENFKVEQPNFYMDPPAWYDGPDIAGVPAWLNDNRVNVRKGPSLTSPVIKQLNTGDFVLIKGRANPSHQGELPFWSESDYVEKGYESWIKVRLPDRTDGYIYGEYLTLKNPKFYPIEEDPYKNSER